MPTGDAQRFHDHGDTLTEPLLESLTPAQREAVTHGDGPLLVLAGPGSGKTRVITHRIAYLLQQGVPARQILALTFTNKAASEMRARVERLAPGESVWTSTFHRFCARLLRQHAPLVGLRENYSIYDVDAARQVLKRTIDELGLDTTHVTLDRIASAISWAKNNLLTPEQYESLASRAVDAVVAKLYPAYQARLLASSAVDFDDLLLHAATFLRENLEVRASLDGRHRYVLVDEYQDTNLAQYTIVRALSIDFPNLAVTGDPDQSIYGWRGANLNNILDFEHDFPQARVVKLERNYRSTKAILRVADALIAHNVRRKLKALYTENEEGSPVELAALATQQDEADSIAARIAEAIRSGRRRPRDFAVFYRLNALSRSIEFALREQGVPYQMVNGLEFYQRKEIKDVLAYLHLLNNPRDDVALARVINEPPRGIGKGTLAKLVEHAARRGGSLLDAARESGLVTGLGTRAAVAVAKFVALYDRLSLLAARPVEEIVGSVLELSEYQKTLKESGDEADQDRLANVQELLTAARQFDEHNPGEGRLEQFLEEASLVNETDAWEVNDDRATLMTLHASKGLEFPVVFILALEEGILPHERCRKDQHLLEEERRLLFVGITRAQQELCLSIAQHRDFRGVRRRTVPSNFLMELPRDQMLLRLHETAPRVGRAWDDSESYVHEHAEPDEPQFVEAAPKAAHSPTVAALTTAAQLHGEVATAPVPVSPDAFYQGMVVAHPEYGLGKVIALGGSGTRRSATVAFASSAGEKHFMLAQSDLRPAK